MATVEGHWEPGIGDPTVGGWITVVAYGVAAWCCWQARKAQGIRHATAPARFWLLVCAAMALLGVNKQLDLQTAFTELGREIARSEGWYGQRHEVQIGFIAWISLAGAVAAGWLGRLSWPLSRGRGLALGGLAFLLVFVLVRASSFHHVDLWLTDTALGLRWNWILELSGIALVAHGAHRERRVFSRAATRRPTAAPPPRPRPARHAAAPAASSTAAPAPAAHAARPPAAAPAPAAAPPPPAAPRRRAVRTDDHQVRSPGDPRTRAGE